MSDDTAHPLYTARVYTGREAKLEARIALLEDAVREGLQGHTPFGSTLRGRWCVRCGNDWPCPAITKAKAAGVEP